MSTQLLPDGDPFNIEGGGGGPQSEGADQAPGSRNAHFMKGAKSGGGDAGGEASEAGGMGAELGELAEVAAVAA